MEEYVICGATLFECVCLLPKGHSEMDPHACDTVNCFGQWFGDEDFFVPVTLPYMRIPCPFTYEDYLRMKEEQNDGGGLRYI
jgi:hypothetical protein